MKLNIVINMDNAAFEDPTELTEILQKLATRCTDLHPAGDEGAIKDSNGNTVGRWEYAGWKSFIDDHFKIITVDVP